MRILNGYSARYKLRRNRGAEFITEPKDSHGYRAGDGQCVRDASAAAATCLAEQVVRLWEFHATQQQRRRTLCIWALYVDRMLVTRALRQKSRADGLAKAGYRADDRAKVMRSIARLDSRCQGKGCGL
jgi:hypothetical protein